MNNDKSLDRHEIRIEFGRTYYLATIIKQNNEGFTTERLQQIAADCSKDLCEHRGKLEKLEIASS